MSDLQKKWGTPPKPTNEKPMKKAKKIDRYNYLEIKSKKMDGILAENSKNPIYLYYLYHSRKNLVLSPDSLLKDDIIKYRKRYIKNNLGDKSYEI
jgi:hypothetical protein